VMNSKDFSFNRGN